MTQESLKERFNPERLLESFQRLISSPAWALGVIVITVVFMASQYVVPKPIDDPKTGFTYTVLAYTLLSLWVENFQKMSTREQAEKDEERDRLQQERDEKFQTTMALSATAQAVALEAVKSLSTQVRDQQTIMLATVGASNELMEKILDQIEVDKGKGD